MQSISLMFTQNLTSEGMTCGMGWESCMMGEPDHLVQAPILEIWILWSTIFLSRQLSWDWHGNVFGFGGI